MRTFSICEQSTRYCDFAKDKFDRELSFIVPQWCDKDELQKKYYSSSISTDTPDNLYILILGQLESIYKQLRKLGWKPEQARQVLPLGLKTQAIYTAYVDDWQHFLALRADNVSGKAHPNIQFVANEIRRIAKENKLW